MTGKIRKIFTLALLPLLLFFSQSAFAEIDLTKDVIQVDLPATWTILEESSDKDHWALVAQSQSVTEVVIVAAYPHYRKSNNQTRKTMLLDFVKAKIENDLRTGGPKFVIKNKQLNEDTDEVRHIYELHYETGKRAINISISNEAGFGNFYYESFGLTAEEFERKKMLYIKNPH